MSRRGRYLVYRALSTLPTLFGLIVITFVLSHVVPGNPALYVIGPEFDPTTYKVVEAEMGLDKPLWTQFWIYLTQLVQGNLGFSYVQQQFVSQEIASRLPASIELAVAALAISVPGGLYLGIYAGLRANKPSDHAIRVFTLLGISMPVFWIELVMIIAFYFYLGVAPAPVGQISSGLAPPPPITGATAFDSLITGNVADFGDAMWHIVLPAVGLSLAGIATLSRVVRSSMLDVLNKDYMRTVYAIGLPRKVIVNKYALRNAMLPAITIAALYAGALMSGVVLTETVFSWPGLGLYAVSSIDFSDYPSIMGVVLVSGILFVFFNFLADLLYAFVDPRVQL